MSPVPNPHHSRIAAQHLAEISVDLRIPRFDTSSEGVSKCERYAQQIVNAYFPPNREYKDAVLTGQGVLLMRKEGHVDQAYEQVPIIILKDHESETTFIPLVCAQGKVRGFLLAQNIAGGFIPSRTDKMPEDFIRVIRPKELREAAEISATFQLTDFNINETYRSQFEPTDHQLIIEFKLPPRP